MSITTSGVVAEIDLDGEVRSKALSKSQALLDADIEAILNDDANEVGAVTENETILLLNKQLSMSRQLSALKTFLLSLRDLIFFSSRL